MQTTICSKVFPLPPFDILPVYDPGGQGPGFYVIAVARSPLAPHAVKVGDTLRYPRRSGTTTDYLSEPEVADAYRARFAGARRQGDRAELIEREALARLSVADHRCWVVVSLVPDFSGELVITDAAHTAMQHEIVGRRTSLIGSWGSWYRVHVGRRRYILDGNMNLQRLAGWAAAELHTDGSGVYAIRVLELGKHRLDG